MKIIGNIAVFFGLLFYRGLAVVLGWQWFVSPFGIPAIGYAHALGISLFIAMLTHENYDTKQKPFHELAIEGGLSLTLIIAFMWIYEQFM